jgi:hypothetical protein
MTGERGRGMIEARRKYLQVKSFMKFDEDKRFLRCFVCENDAHR